MLVKESGAKTNSVNDSKEKTETTSEFVKLQEKIDTIVEKYLSTHEHIVRVAKAKDRALAGKSSDEVKQELASYPGIIAIAVHEEAHKLYTEAEKLEDKTAANLKKIQARKLAEAAHSRTGADIHPGAQIDKDFFLDHATGVVIGETAKVGSKILMYHEVTLGAVGKCAAKDRHPKIGNGCVLSVGAKILGNIVVGEKSRIGPNALLSGNNIELKDHVSIGSSVKIESEREDSKPIIVGNHVTIGSSAKIFAGNEIADKVVIGEGAVITANTGLINQDIPAYSQVFRDGKELKIVSLMQQDKDISILQRTVNMIKSVLNIVDTESHLNGHVGLNNKNTTAYNFSI